MAALKYICPKCGVILKVPKLSTGKNIKCERCGVEFFAEPAKTKKKKTAVVLIIVFLVLAGVFYIYYLEEEDSYKRQLFEEAAKDLLEKHYKDLPIVFKSFVGFRQESEDKYTAVVKVGYEQIKWADKADKIGIKAVQKDLFFYIEIEDWGESYLYKFSEETATVLEQIRRETAFRSFNNNDGGNE